MREGFLAEHASIVALLNAVIGAVGAGDDARAAEAWRAFASGLLAHLDAEDGLLVSAPPQERGARILVHEHRFIRGCVSELERAAGRRALSRRALENLRDVLSAHLRNDDRFLYTWAEDGLGERLREAALAALGARLAAMSPPPAR
ncbi:MAG: hemerythrin domain-containing protein [Labilithrix sp.]|nr:hemerythrin domain-containing protein [Labilithrix sp.]